MWQYGLSGAISGTFSRISQLSDVERPPVKPPCTVRPLRGRALTVMSIAVELRWYWSP